MKLAPLWTPLALAVLVSGCVQFVPSRLEDNPELATVFLKAQPGPGQFAATTTLRSIDGVPVRRSRVRMQPGRHIFEFKYRQPLTLTIHELKLPYELRDGQKYLWHLLADAIVREHRKEWFEGWIETPK